MTITLNGTTGITSTGITETSDGNVGIGTSSHYDASTKLTVAGRINTSNGTAIGSMNYGGGAVVNIGSLSNHPVQLMTNNTTRVVVDSDGRVTMPYQPMATFYGTSVVTATEAAIISWLNSAHEQGGLTANTSTNRFTVPVAGKYFVAVNITMSATATNDVGDGIYLNIKKNGSVYLANNAQAMFRFGSTSGEETLFNHSMIVSCSANDYVDFSFTSIGSTAVIQYGSAHIYLIG